MRAAGADAILVGESLITADDTAAKVKELSSVRITRLTGMEANVPKEAIEQTIPGFGNIPGQGYPTPGGGVPGIGGFGPPRFPGMPGDFGPFGPRGS